jgi:hypothetical protein
MNIKGMHKRNYWEIVGALVEHTLLALLLHLMTLSLHLGNQFEGDNHPRAPRGNLDLITDPQPKLFFSLLLIPFMYSVVYKHLFFEHGV